MELKLEGKIWEQIREQIIKETQERLVESFKEWYRGHCNYSFKIFRGNNTLQVTVHILLTKKDVEALLREVAQDAQKAKHS
ncbi:hypothetical protein DRP04_06095 [Archaeoglobales archaeon]|nr:MAG: hypothetical protein DRP04_06095 [Archaeoglobales archaeon]